ncbi:MAG: glycosyltransferase [bacterium]
MVEQSPRILQVSTSDGGGGAEKVAYNLHHTYLGRGYSAWLAVGYKWTDDPGILVIADHSCGSLWTRFWFSIGNGLSSLVGRVRGAGRLRNYIQLIGQPRRLLETHRGHEDFYFPGTWRLLDLTPEGPDIVHCHNLHGGYFDLRALPWLSQQVPVILTLHDAWLLSGHCAHSFDCERWRTGCGQCPDLTIYPAIRRDGTAYNWRRKKKIFEKSRLYVATPSRWLMQKVEQSMLAPAIVEARVIPNGVDLSVFHPSEKPAVRAALGMPPNAKVLLFAANGIRRNPWKDYGTLRGAVALIAGSMRGQRLLFVALGEDAPAERIGRAEIQFVPYQKDSAAVALYYQAADVYTHAARADTFPNTVLEALACGVPVVATAVGGIPEQIKGLEWEAHPRAYPSYPPQQATGILVPPKNPEMLAKALCLLLEDGNLRECLGANAAQEARIRFDLQKQVDAYLEWFQEILSRWSHPKKG